jgi:hypothetical protein
MNAPHRNTRLVVQESGFVTAEKRKNMQIVYEFISPPG